MGYRLTIIGAHRTEHDINADEYDVDTGDDNARIVFLDSNRDIIAEVYVSNRHSFLVEHKQSW